MMYCMVSYEGLVKLLLQLRITERAEYLGNAYKRRPVQPPKTSSLMIGTYLERPPKASRVKNIVLVSARMV